MHYEKCAAIPDDWQNISLSIIFSCNIYGLGYTDLDLRLKILLNEHLVKSVDWKVSYSHLKSVYQTQNL